MGSKPIEGENKNASLISEIRNALLLALKHSRGENTNFIRVERYIRAGLDKLSEMEEVKKEEPKWMKK